MADDLRLYFLECGSLKTQVQYIKMNQGLGDPYEIPVPFFLITHPRGNVLFDGGNALEVARDARAHWGVVVDAYEPVMSEDDFVVNQLQRLDIDPASVRYVVQSHLHLDHSGAIGHFPNAEYVVQRRELEYAYTPDWFQKTAYIRPDFDKDVRWLFLDGPNDDGYDLFGDGTIKTLFTPGHAPGHTSLVVTLEGEGPMMLTADACYTMDHYEEKALPGLIHSAADVAYSVRKIHREVDRLGATVVTGHDPDAWPKFKKAPEYYS
ncbi:MAG: N-acyl homoserine lactonase family protein [Rubrobacteraceae bacterium]|uniref:AttM family quorum-quenching N-acyl homoserine lactonase n=1 Tax=Rubrobacter naiadicus TaxID=1392641 RepID=UPI00236120AA|nr:N-acyl homoserine lactonase family protein [Rubrobacter naiadicus]MBX6762284.1 N-acyl homoserine lactonase family protein [Rubrobacteraceae bacterium]